MIIELTFDKKITSAENPWNKTRKRLHSKVSSIFIVYCKYSSKFTSGELSHEYILDFVVKWLVRKFSVPKSPKTPKKKARLKSQLCLLFYTINAAVHLQMVNLVVIVCNKLCSKLTFDKFISTGKPRNTTKRRHDPGSGFFSLFFYCREWISSSFLLGTCNAPQ